MCGIAGIVDWSRPDHGQLRSIVGSMADALTHRGPDGSGVWTHPLQPLAFGHRRLRILDLSENGAQPMTSHSGRFTLTFNGEIYNYVELAADLALSGVKVTATSDTRVLCEAIDTWGLAATLQRADGMFGIACWDDELRELHLTRDRFGEKPLYYQTDRHGLRFGSELKSLVADERFRPAINYAAVDAVLRSFYIPAEMSIYEGVAQVPPGTVMTYRMESREFQPPVQYWCPEDLLCRSNRLTDPEAATEQLLDVLKTSIGRRLRSDVPVGCFLSGGVDSSLVTAVAADVSPRKVISFTAGFEDAEFDESPHGRAVAAHLGTEHHDLRVTSSDALELIPRLADLYDEPFADSSQIPMHLISKLARQEVTVALSGDGGDELFGGYTRYARVRAMERWRSSFGPAARPIASALDRVGLLGRLPDVVRKGSAAMAASDLWQLYSLEKAKWYPDGSPLLEGAPTWEAWPDTPTKIPRDPTELMMFHDMTNYLPGDILTKVDRASMATSLETRLPLLSQDMAELAWNIGPELRHRGSVAKAPLRLVLDQLVPKELTDRPKAGFAVPIERWLRGPLRPWGEDLLSAASIERHGLLNPSRARSLWDAFQQGQSNLGSSCWAMITIQAWADRWMR
ncbi:MAG: asparagine synthase (glutamine-hydrolyzing) [Acidimicrobiales bacterium]